MIDTVEQYQGGNKNRFISWASTFIIHAILLVLLWFAVLRTPDPPIGFGGMELSMALGSPDMGGPNDIPTEDPIAISSPQEIMDDEQILTQDAEDVSVSAKKVEENKKIETKPKVEKKIEAPVEKPRSADERSLFKKKTTNTTEGGRGDGSIPGNEGTEDGDPNGSPDGNGVGDGLGGSGGGTGMGDGLGSYDLKGRSIARKPDITDNSRETGKVVVAITVDRTGQVIKVQPGIKGTTNLSPVLLEKARQGALQARFSPKPNGPEEQYGTMTFVFKFKQ
jgi:TonB family protein